MGKRRKTQCIGQGDPPAMDIKSPLGIVIEISFPGKTIALIGNGEFNFRPKPSHRKGGPPLGPRRRW